MFRKLKTAVVFLKYLMTREFDAFMVFLSNYEGGIDPSLILSHVSTVPSCKRITELKLTRPVDLNYLSNRQCAIFTASIYTPRDFVEGYQSWTDIRENKFASSAGFMPQLSTVKLSSPIQW